MLEFAKLFTPMYECLICRLLASNCPFTLSAVFAFSINVAFKIALPLVDISIPFHKPAPWEPWVIGIADEKK